AYASDLNPVAVLINKAMIEIPPKFAGRPPVHPDVRRDKKLFAKEWKGAEGLAEDVRRYGQWMRDEAEKRIGHLYPKVEITAEMAKERPDLKPLVGQKLTVIAWIWARTVKSPSPAFAHADVPLMSTFVLSSKESAGAFILPAVQHDSYSFAVKVGLPPANAKGGTSIGKQKGFRCLLSDVPVTYEYIRSEASFGRMGKRLVAIVADGPDGRIYVPPVSEHEQLASQCNPTWKPDLKIPDQALGFRVQLYGMTSFGDLFTARQLVGMATFAELVNETRSQVSTAVGATALPGDSRPLAADGRGTVAYADAVSTYLGMAVGRAADYWTVNATWEPSGGFVGHTFTKQALPMVWDFAEANPFSDASGNWEGTALEWIPRAMSIFPCEPSGCVSQSDAKEQSLTVGKFVSTDPPYYDNIGYADLSDFFYVWMRKSLRGVFPTELATIAVPKADELIATPHRHGTKEKAERFFLNGMGLAMRRIATHAQAGYPIS
ncbi:MAG: DUF1156 domain-containing protein, partial [Betaproteobacteria bacterium]|nr:DUF1156 domain-containing protein [Betaproteobacteria bacterium]